MTPPAHRLFAAPHRSLRAILVCQILENPTRSWVSTEYFFLMTYASQSRLGAGKVLIQGMRTP